ncbi:MAG: hypothetical protein J6Y29_07145 [Clostridiales bacterium]|nr:hypothetical protein [Clostridiales bacterium]
MKKEKGSAIAMSLVFLIFLTYFSVLIIDMAYTNVSLSRSYSGDRRIYRGTDYIVNMISVRLQNEIKKIQEDARDETEAEIKKSSTLDAWKDDVSKAYLTKTGAMTEEDYEYEFNLMYKQNYLEKFNASQYAQSVYSESLLKHLSVNQSTPQDGYYYLKLIQGEDMYYKLSSAGYDSQNHIVKCVIDIKFEYTNDIRGVGDEKTNLQNKTTTTVEFKISDGSDDFNLQNYKVVNKKNDLLPAFSRQMALLSERNVVFLGKDKEINILGDVIAFGYVPTELGGGEKKSADWTEYGGILFGYSKKMKDSMRSIYGSTWENHMGSLEDNINAGSVKIEGDVSTLGHINIARDIDRSRLIQICGDTYARQFIMSEDSHYSNIWLGYTGNDEERSLFTLMGGEEKTKNELLGKGNLYVTDDLQVDSSFAKLVVEGDFYGLSSSYVFVGGDNLSESMSSDQQETGRKTDLTNEKRISTLNINGNSVVELRRKVYIGGTSVLTNIRDSNGNAYVTGISGAKTSQLSSEAYIKSKKNKYVYTRDTKKDAKTKEYTHFKEASEYNNETINMINGYENKTDDLFTLDDRAKHFKGYFEDRILDNFGLMGTMNFGNLRIKTDKDKKIQGWAEGVIIAAGIGDFYNILDTEEINAYYGEGYSESAADVFDKKSENPFSQYSIIQKYQETMATFFETKNFGYEGRKIVQTSVDKHLTDYLNKSNSVFNVIKNNVVGGVYLHTNDELDAHLYYSKNNITRMYKSGSDIYLESNSVTKKLDYSQGIVFVEGDIFIEDGVEFTGIIIASGNITLYGEVNISRYADNGSGMDIVNKLKEEDYYVRTFFGLNDYDIDDNNAVIDRINQDYVKIVKWEVK